jgi:hypothetical protein
LDHHGRRRIIWVVGIVGVVRVRRAPPAGSPPRRPSPPAEAPADEDPRAPVPPAAAVVPVAAPPGATAMEPGAAPWGSGVPPAGPMPSAADPTGASRVGRDAAPNGSPVRSAAALEPAAAPARRLGGEDRSSHQQPCRHNCQDHLLHGQSPCAVPNRSIGAPHARAGWPPCGCVSWSILTSILPYGSDGFRFFHWGTLFPMLICQPGAEEHRSVPGFQPPSLRAGDEWLDRILYSG